MNPRFLTPRLHGLLDYAAAAGLIVLPFVLGFSATAPLALGLSLTLGVTLVTYSLLTDYRFGLFRVLSYRGHIVLDLLAALGMSLIPPVFGFTGLVAGYFWFMAGGVVLVVAISTPNTGVFVQEGSPAGRFSESRS